MKRRSWSRARKALPTNAELAILDALWTLGEGTVEDVIDRLPSSPPANYKTVQSLLRIMEGKGFVRHTTRGRAFVFNSRVTRDEVGGSLTKHLLDRTFQGSCSALMMNLLDSNSVKDQELDELEALIQGYRERKNKDESSNLRWVGFALSRLKWSAAESSASSPDILCFSRLPGSPRDLNAVMFFGCFFSLEQRSIGPLCLRN